MDYNHRSDTIITMDTNYTALDVVSFQEKREIRQSSHKSFDMSVVFLSLVVITLVILAVLLFILIQKKMQELSLVTPFFA